MPAEDTTAELQRGGKRATPLGHLKTYRTAIFKLHNPSQKKRAMLRDCMRRAHLAYSSLLGEFMPAPDEVKRLSALPKRGRQEHLKPLVAAIVKRAQNVPQLALAARDGNRVDIIAAIKSHIGLQDEQDEVGLPTVGRLDAFAGTLSQCVEIGRGLLVNGALSGVAVDREVSVCLKDG